MKNILLPTDFSQNSLNAMFYAIALFKDMPCKFYLLNVFKVPYLTNEEYLEYDMKQSVLFEKELFDSSQERMKEELKKLKIKASDDHTFELLSDYNFFSDSVKNYVKEKKIDLIVMGTKGATGAKEIFMGSNTGDVIMKTECDILAVPENATFKVPKEITFPTDYKIAYKKEDIALLIELAEIYESSIRVLHFSEKGDLDEKQKFNKESLNKYIEKVNPTYHTLTNKDFEVALNCFTQSRGNIDMIALIAKHYNFFQRLFFKPKVEELSFHTKIPLLVLHKTE